ncbi:MAG: response regulator [Alistipes senegalensis]|nr:response regulator [Oxalobacter formigenes]MCM1280633.1 response regulator [Alistipes senegalensis]
MATILVVDDEIGIRELLSEILSDEGHVVYTAENAQQARESRAAHSPDLVLLDIWMPDTDGISLLKEWRRENLLVMPVIMMSGHASIDTAVDATRHGALGFLEKPIALQKLLKAVEHALHGLPEKPPLPTPAQPAGTAASRAENTPSRPGSPEAASPPSAGSTPPSAPASLLNFNLPLREARDMFERIYFEHHLAVEGGSMTRVAEKAGLERTHLYRKLKQLHIEPQKASKKNSR